ncbi:MAG: hypothetical protein HY319_29910 [Armatimonadetes bacterium]|nr:hypothetical protein [Armatimonadota bacterium]
MAHPAGGGLDTWVALKWIITWTVLLGGSVYLPLWLFKPWPHVDTEPHEDLPHARQRPWV